MLIPRVQSGGRALLAESFRKSGARVFEVAAYESRCPDAIPKITADLLSNKKADIIAFTSTKTVKNTAQLIKKYPCNSQNELLEGVKIVSIGPQTSKGCIRYFKRVDKEAKSHDIEGLVQACIDCINQ